MNSVRVIMIVSIFITGCNKKDRKIQASATTKDTKLVEDKKITFYTTQEFYILKPFEGRVIKYEIHGVPATPHDFSGFIINIFIESNDNKTLVVKEFLSGKHAHDELELLMKKKQCQFPDDVYALRDTILFD